VDLEPLDWARDGGDWPNRDVSRFLVAGGLRWHVQQFGRGDPLLLIHGAGAATHSWRDLAPLLADQYRVIAFDLPGHGFSEAPGETWTLPQVASAVAALLERLDAAPAVTVGHSAGAALAAWMAVEGLVTPRLLVSLNGAHLPLRGIPGWFYGPVARMIGESEMLPVMLSRRAQRRAVVERLLRDTGSTLDARGIDCYWRLARSPAHVAAALRLMAGWDVRPLERRLPGLDVPMCLVTGSCDRTVPPADSLRVRELVPRARWIPQPGLGHLAHEERPEATAALIREAEPAAASVRLPGG